MKPNFEPPVHTARDILERGIKVYTSPNSYLSKQWLSQHYIPEYRKIGENMIITKSWGQYKAITKNKFLIQGTYARRNSFIEIFELAWAKEINHDQGVTIVSTEYMTQKGEYKRNYGRGYYRGEKIVGRIPGSGYLTNKKWHLNEVCLLLVALTEFQIYVCQMF